MVTKNFGELAAAYAERLLSIEIVVSASPCTSSNGVVMPVKCEPPPTAPVNEMTALKRGSRSAGL